MTENRQNKQTKKILSLKKKKGRDNEGLFIVEGERFVNDIPKDWPVEKYILSHSFNSTHEILPFLGRAKTEIVSDELFALLSDTVTPQGIMAVCHKKDCTLEDLSGKNHFLLVAHSINDPGNLGTIIRTADAAGATGVILCNCVELYNPKVIRAAAASVFNIKIVSASTDAMLSFLKLSGVTLIGTHLKATSSMYEPDYKKPSAILIGNEASGIPDELSMACDCLVKIPMLGKAQSLNVSVAGALLLYEAVRQRKFMV